VAIPSNSKPAASQAFSRRRSRATAVCCALLASAAAVACMNAIHVETAIAPDANLSSAHTYRFLLVPAARKPQETSNPMFESSITGQQVKRDIGQALQSRGYVRQEDNADLSVAYYISAKQKLEVTDYNYGYAFWGWHRWRWWGGPWGAWPAQEITQFEEGTIIIDILDGSGKTLLWRGMGKSDVPDDAQEYAKDVDNTVHAIMRHFPGRVQPM
jgi:hypothetical protein